MPPRNSTHWSTRTTRHQAGVPDTPSSVVETARSRRSSRSAKREVEACRTERTHGWARPFDASSHMDRTVVSTRAFCT